MSISSLSQEQVDEFVSQRERLLPLASSLGLVYDEDDVRLMNALDVIWTAQAKRGLVASYKPGMSTASQSARGFLMPRADDPDSQLAAAHAAVAALGVAPQQTRKQPTKDMGEQVCDALRAMGCMPPVRTTGGR